MRYVLATVLSLTGTLLLGVAAGEAACQAGGDYHVTGLTLAGRATLTETSSEPSRSSGNVTLQLAATVVSPVAGNTVVHASGRYDAVLTEDGCVITLVVLEGPSGQSGSVSGVLAFGGAVILFETHNDARLNLSIGIRSTFFLRE